MMLAVGTRARALSPLEQLARLAGLPDGTLVGTILR